MRAMNRDPVQAAQQPEDSAEFLRLYAAAQPQLFAYIYTLLPDWNDAEEVLQETSLALWRSFGKFRPGSNFKAWACKTAFYQVLSFRKRRDLTPVLVSHDVVEAVAKEAADMSGSLDDQLRALSGCIKKLKAGDKHLLDRFYGSGLSVKMIAGEFGHPVGTVTKSLTRIRRTLFACIERALAIGNPR